MIIAANWKMNLSREQALHHLTRSSQLDASCARPPIRILCAGLLFRHGRRDIIISRGYWLGWSGLSSDEAGAFTGDISADMLLGFGCGWALIGHSERRQYHFETDRQIARKTAHALKRGFG